MMLKGRSLHLKKFQLMIKNIFDFLFSLSGIVMLVPVYIMTIVLLKITMPGPIFFKQKRVGKDGREFEVLKFRTMKVDEVAEKNLDCSMDAERITSFGKILRRTKIDETPQLFNVLKGEMSLVGPRPTLKNQVENYDEFQNQRLNVKPGMTGLAQVNGNVALTWEERIIYDVSYVNNFSLLLDANIILKTVLIVIFGEEKFKRIPNTSKEEKIKEEVGM